MDATDFSRPGELLLGLGRVHSARLVLETGRPLPNATPEFLGNLAESLRRCLQPAHRRRLLPTASEIQPADVLTLYLQAFRGGAGRRTPWLLYNAAGFGAQHWDVARRMKWQRDMLMAKVGALPFLSATILGAVVADNTDAASFGLDALQKSAPHDPQVYALSAVVNDGITPETLDALDDEALKFLLRTYQETGLVEGVVLVSIGLLNRDPGNPEFLEAYGATIETALAGGPNAPELGSYHPTAAGRALLELSGSLLDDDPDGAWRRRHLYAQMRGGKDPEYVLQSLAENSVDLASVPASYFFTIAEALLFRSQDLGTAKQLLQLLCIRDSHTDYRAHALHAFVALSCSNRWQGVADLIHARRLGLPSSPLRDAKRVRDIHFAGAPLLGHTTDAEFDAVISEAWEQLLAGELEAARKAATDALNGVQGRPAAEFELRLILAESLFPIARSSPNILKNFGRILTVFGELRQAETDVRGFLAADRVARAIASRALDAAELSRSVNTALFFMQRSKLQTLHHAIANATKMPASLTMEYAQGVNEAFELSPPDAAPPHLFTTLAEVAITEAAMIDLDTPWNEALDGRLAALRAANPNTALAGAFVPEKPVGLQDLQRQLRPNDVYVEFALFADVVYAVVVRRSDSEVIRIPLDEPLGPAARFAWGCAAQPPAAPVGWSAADDCWPLQLLYATLIGPLQQWFDGAERLIVAPSGPLHRIPFGILHDGAHFLIERWEVVQVPTAAVFAGLTITNTHFALESLAITDPDGTWGEAATGGIRLAQLCPRSQHFDQISIPADRAISLMGSAAFVHLSCRGFIDLDFPLFSPIFLGRGFAEPMAMLQPFAMLKSRSNPALITIDGMASEAAREGADTELVHPAAMLHAAGASNVIATAWRTDPDAIGELFSTFYDELEDEPVARALAQAQRRMLAEPPTSHPYYWGAPILSGEGHTYINGLRDLEII